MEKNDQTGNQANGEPTLMLVEKTKKALWSLVI